MAAPAGARQAEAGEEGPGELRRAISRRMLTVFVVGDVLGAGVYALIGEMAGEVGGAIWAAFLVAMALAVLTATAYAELATKYPYAAGAALYVNRAFKRSFVTFIVAFGVAMSGIASASTAALAFGGEYLAEFVTLPSALVALGFIAVLAVINFIGIEQSVRANAVFTTIEVGGLLLIIVIGVAALLGGTGDPGRAFEFSSETSVPLAILGGASLAFFAFLGFEDSVNLAEETRDPGRSYPPALFGGLAIATVIYLLVAFTAAMVVDIGRLSESDGPLLEVVREGPIAIPLRLFAVVALIAVTNSALINMIMASRLTYGMANEGIVPRMFGRVHRSRRTPFVAIVFTSLVAAALVSTADDLGDLADTTVLLLLVVFTLVNVAVLVLRRDPVEHVHFRAPTALPILGAVACLGLLTQQEARIWLRAGILLLIGAALYLVNRGVRGRVDDIDASALKG